SPAAVSERSARRSAVRLVLVFAIVPAVSDAGRVFACKATSAPADASATAIAAPSPRDAPVTSATRPSRRNGLPSGKKVLADGREDVDHHRPFLKDRRAMKTAGTEMNDVARRGDVVTSLDGEAHASAFDEHH